jgi:ATPase subunit of ABC transporter with duplicated ATPase domains
MILVSHDREFLDQVCNKIVDVEEGKLITYRANYSKFLLQRNERLTSWKERYSRQCNYIKEEENWIRRAKTNPMHSGQAKTRENALEKYKKSSDFLLRPPLDRSFRFRFPEPPEKGSSGGARRLLEVMNLKHGFDMVSPPPPPTTIIAENEGINSEQGIKNEQEINTEGTNKESSTTTTTTVNTTNRITTSSTTEPTIVGKASCLFKNVNFYINKGDRVGFIGPNGSGKSTMLKLLMGFFKPQTGEIQLVSKSLKMNYYAQNQADLLDLEKTVLQTVSENADSSMTQLQIRTLLGQFLFRGNDVFKKVSVLSGGEKSRVSLCKMMLQPSHMLLLDEPTNHLDITAKEVLEDALLHYSGGVIVVSHDRYFMSQIVKSIYEFGKPDGKGVVEYNCDYHDYLEELARIELRIASNKLYSIVNARERERKEKAKKEKLEKEKENEPKRNALQPATAAAIESKNKKLADLLLEPREDPGELDIPLSLKDRIASRYIKGDTKNRISKAKNVILKKKNERTKNFGGSGVRSGDPFKGIKNAKRYLKRG